MSRIADYVKTLSPAERERFANLIEECAAREVAISGSAARADEALRVLEAREREFKERLTELAHLSERLRDDVTRLYLVSVPPRGRVS